MTWYRGNLHTHTSNSDGDSPPDVVVAWYRNAGYDFLALTDHDLLTLPGDHAAVAGPMLLIHGEEVTAGDIHVNALGIRRAIAPALRGSAAETLQANVDAVRSGGGVATVNHPNFRWTLRPSDLAAITDCVLFEIHNAGPGANNLGGPDHPSHEGLWDLLLSQGRRMFGLAVDDAHHFRLWGRQYLNPGRAWVHIQAERADEPSLLTALTAGRFYASTGVELASVSATAGTLAIDIVQSLDAAYRTTLIGEGGRVLDVVDGVEPRFRWRDGMRYVRARVDDSEGLCAWVQPVFEG